MKSKIIILVLVVMSFSQQKMLYSQSSEIMENTLILSVLQNGLENYLDKIPVGKENDFGFNSREEFNKIVFGDPMQIYSISENSSSEIHFLPTKKWKVPLIVNDSYRCLLDISFNNGNYKVVGIGLNELASDIDNYERHKNLKSIQQKSLFMDYSLNVYCILIKNLNKHLEFIPFRPMNIEPEITIKNRYSSEELLNVIQLLRKNISYE